MEVQIRKFETHYRLPPWARAEQRRLDQVRTIVLEDAFEMALADAGMREEAELCIRNLFVPVRLRLDRSDESITERWSAALAEEIACALRNRSTPNVVVYYSRRQALMDLALSVACEDFRRVWAWRQLGLWRSSSVTGESEAIGELVDALRGTPAMVAPLLNALARAGRLRSIATRLTATQWEDLASAALDEAGAGHLLDAVDDMPSSRALSDAWRVLKNSFLLRALAPGALSGAGTFTRRAFAALAVMTADPSLLHHETAQTLVGIIADVIAGNPTSAGDELVDPSTTDRAEFEAQRGSHSADLADGDARDSTALDASDPTASDLRESAAGDSRGSTTRAAANSLAPDSSVATLHGVDQEKSGVELPTASDGAEPTRRRTAHTPEAQDGGELEEAALDSVGKTGREETELLDLRRRGLTSFGGLLFLIAVIEDLDLPKQIRAHSLLGLRPFIWVVHQLALALATIEPTDPAALAFAGLGPDEKSPAEEEAPPSESEVCALNTLAAQIVAGLCALLEREDRPEGSVLEFVCRRRAEIVADPGWIEVRLSLDDVSTEIRRAGLDLNPGHVPWLGVVVVFAYE